MAQQYEKSLSVESMSDAQLIALFLTKSHERSALELATAMVHDAGSLQRVVNPCRVADDRVTYLTERQQLVINAGMEISRRIAYDAIRATGLQTPIMIY